MNVKKGADRDEATYRLINSQVLFDHRYVRILQDTLECAGRQQEYVYLISPVDSVATVGLTEAGEILLTRQYRHPLGREIYDLPAGSLHPGEQPLAGARREFEEETGYLPEHIELLGVYNQFPGTLQVATHLFFACELHPTSQHLDEDEQLQVAAMPVPAVLDLIRDGQVVDGSLQLGVLLAKLKGLLPEG